MADFWTIKSVQPLCEKLGFAKPTLKYKSSPRPGVLCVLEPEGKEYVVNYIDIMGRILIENLTLIYKFRRRGCVCVCVYLLSPPPIYKV